MDNLHSFYWIKSLKFSVLLTLTESPTQSRLNARLWGGSRISQHFQKAPIDAPGTNVPCVCVCVSVCVSARTLSAAPSRPTLCNPVSCSPPGSSVHGILQARILEWAAISSSRGSSRPRNRTLISCIVAGGFFATVSEKPKNST